EGRRRGRENVGAKAPRGGGTPPAPARPPGPPRDSDRLDAATGKNRATKRPPPPPCWSPARATPAPPSLARHVAPASIAPCDMKRITSCDANQAQIRNANPR